MSTRPSSDTTAKPTTIILVRHAESTWNAADRWQGQADPPLSDSGRGQAQRVAQRLRSEPISALYTSDLSRALETAWIIGQALGLEPRPEPRLQELNVGAWAGLTREQIAARYPEQFRAWQAHEPIRPGGGERFLDMQERTVAALEEIVAAHPGETICLVTHGGVVYALRGHVLGLSLGPELFQGLPPNRNTAITIIRCLDGQGKIEVLMDASHLPQAGESRQIGNSGGGD